MFGLKDEIAKLKAQRRGMLENQSQSQSQSQSQNQQKPAETPKQDPITINNELNSNVQNSQNELTANLPNENENPGPKLKFTRQKEIIEEKLKTFNESGDYYLTRNFNELEKSNEEWLGDFSKVYQPSSKFKNSNSSFFNFRKCEKQAKKDINKLKSAVRDDLETENEKNTENNNDDKKLKNDLLGDFVKKELNVKTPLNNEAIIEKLRNLKAPIKLFGESDTERQIRLKRLENGESLETILSERKTSEIENKIIDTEKSIKDDDDNEEEEAVAFEEDNKSEKKAENDDLNNIENNYRKVWVNRVKPEKYDFNFKK